MFSMTTFFEISFNFQIVSSFTSKEQILTKDFNILLCEIVRNINFQLFPVILKIFFLSLQYSYSLFYSKFCHKSILENRLQEKKVISKIRWGKVENFTLNPHILDSFLI